MKITYDADADAAYIRIVDAIHDGEVHETHRLSEDPEVNLDVDAAGRLLGFDVLSASRTLRPEVLEQAECL